MRIWCEDWKHCTGLGFVCVKLDTDSKSCSFILVLIFGLARLSAAFLLYTLPGFAKKAKSKPLNEVPSVPEELEPENPRDSVVENEEKTEILFERKLESDATEDKVEPNIEVEKQSEEMAIAENSKKEDDPRDLLGGLRLLVENVQQVSAFARTHCLSAHNMVTTTEMAVTQLTSN